MYNKIHKIFIIAYGALLLLLIAYLFLLLTSASDVISFKTFAIVVITFIIGSVIPFASYRLLENANKSDKNAAITEYATLLEQKYNVSFNRRNSAYINQACVFVKNDTGEKFWGIATVDEDGKTPILKTFSDYKIVE